MAVAVVAAVAIGLAISLLTGPNLGNAIGAAAALAAGAVAGVLGLRAGSRQKRQGDRMVQILSPRVKESHSGNTEGGRLTTFVLDNDLVLQSGGPSLPSFFSAYFAEGDTPLSLSLSDVRRWNSGWGIFRRETGHVEQALDPSIQVEVESLRDKLHAKSARLDLYVPRDSRRADGLAPRGVVRLAFDPRDYEGLPERLLSVLDPACSLLERAWSSASVRPGLTHI